MKKKGNCIYRDEDGYCAIGVTSMECNIRRAIPNCADYEKIKLPAPKKRGVK